VHIHILGICGTFMGGLAQLARAAGYRVSGCDANVYPPMSDQLAEAGIELIEGFEPGQLDLRADLYVIGNVVTRGNALMEAILDRGLPYASGPEWLRDHVLAGRFVLAVAGTHGKTTTSSMLAWILEHAGLNPGFLIGGVPANFGVSARLGKAPFFVVEADEYDTAFFDKRSKFVHYQPRTLVLNNLEFDHADIFPDLAAIETLLCGQRSLNGTKYPPSALPGWLEEDDAFFRPTEPHAAWRKRVEKFAAGALRAAVKKGNTEVLNLINKGIKAVLEKGIDKQLKTKWLGL